MGSELRFRNNFNLVSRGASLRFDFFFELVAAAAAAAIASSSLVPAFAELRCGCCCFWPYNNLWNTLRGGETERNGENEMRKNEIS